MARATAADLNGDHTEMQASPRPTLSTLDRVAELLIAFTPTRPQWKLQELANHLGWDKATSHRFLTKLVDLRFLERDVEGNFRLGTFILDLSALYMSASPVRQRLARVMNEVRDTTGLTTQAGLLEAGSVVVALSEEGNTLVKASASLGEHLPLHATAIGKAILAQLGEDELEAHVASGLKTFTSRTIATREELLSVVADVRKHGYATANSELTEGLEAIAVPIPRAIFGVPAALGCSGPAVVMESHKDLDKVLLEVARDVRLS